MIITYVSNPYLRAALPLAGHPGEDVLLDLAEADEALAWGYPRVVVLDDGFTGPSTFGGRSPVPTVRISAKDLGRWEAQRVAAGVPGRTEFLADRLRDLLGVRSHDGHVGGPHPRRPEPCGRVTPACRAPRLRTQDPGVPVPLRRPPPGRGAVRPFPRGAEGSLPAPRVFRRPTPTCGGSARMAAAHLLSDRSVTVAQAATRLGFTSDGNLCRSMVSLTSLTPTEARTLRGWNRLPHLVPPGRIWAPRNAKAGRTCSRCSYAAWA